MNDARAVDRIAAKIHALLAGNSPEVQGAAIADLTAIWLAGHCVPGSQNRTDAMRRELFETHCNGVRELVEYYDACRCEEYAP
jgi:hypothetical protein